MLIVCYAILPFGSTSSLQICVNLFTKFHSHISMTFCGVVTPFKGIRVHIRLAMGIPDSETCLEELMCRVLGDLIEEGCVTKIADDLYRGRDAIADLLNNWLRVLKCLNANNLRLNASKTVICPRLGMVRRIITSQQIKTHGTRFSWSPQTIY